MQMTRVAIPYLLEMTHVSMNPDIQEEWGLTVVCHVASSQSTNEMEKHRALED